MPSLADSVQHCERIAKESAGNFYYSFLTLSKPLRRDMCVLYAFMRRTDDIADNVERTPEERLHDLEEWSQSLRDVRRGTPTDSDVLPALHDLVERHAIPDRYLFEVIEGMRMDLTGFEVDTFDELQTYCYHVAGVVGICCIHIWGFRDEIAIEQAIECGLAFQLTNILRDLREDAVLGRTYLPAEELKRFGYSESDLRSQVQNDAFRRLMRFQCDRAAEFYSKSEQLFETVHAPGHPILRAMIDIYGGLLKRIEKADYDVFSKRHSLPRWKKLWIAMRAIVRARLRFGLQQKRG